jgi:hypothetical protein
METSIWVIRSTSKGRGAERWEGRFAKGWRRDFRGLPKIEGLVEGLLECIFLAKLSKLRI